MLETLDLGGHHHLSYFTRENTVESKSANQIVPRGNYVEYQSQEQITGENLMCKDGHPAQMAGHHRVEDPSVEAISNMKQIEGWTIALQHAIHGRNVLSQTMLMHFIRNFTCRTYSRPTNWRYFRIETAQAIEINLTIGFAYHA